MPTILRISKSIGFFLFLILTSIVVAYIFPAPLASVHVASIAITLYILKVERGRIVWYMFFYSFCQELLFPGHVYGAILVAGTISALTAYWSHKFFLTNRSMYTGLLLGMLALWTYRLVWFLYQSMSVILYDTGTRVPSISGGVLVQEIVATEVILLVLLVIFFRKKHRT